MGSSPAPRVNGGLSPTSEAIYPPHGSFCAGARGYSGAHPRVDPPHGSRPATRRTHVRGRGLSSLAMAIYLDHAATSPLRPEVLEAMLPHLTTNAGNPSSLHATGRRARKAIDEAREAIARAHRRTAARDRVHRRRHRGRQPGGQGRGLGGDGARPAPRHHRRRAQGSPQHDRDPRARQLRGHPSCRWTDTAASTRSTSPRRSPSARRW